MGFRHESRSSNPIRVYYPIPYVKTQNIVKLKNPVISIALGDTPIPVMGGAMPSLLSTTGRPQRIVSTSSPFRYRRNSRKLVRMRLGKVDR
jgi:hypothetical protein